MVQLIGRLGRDPEIRRLPSGDPVANLSLATKECWTDRSSGEIRERTEWHRVALFGRLADTAAKHLQKGTLVYVGGRLRTSTWTDSDGAERYSTDIRGDVLRILRQSSAQRQEAGAVCDTSKGFSEKPRNPGEDAFDSMDDDIPF